MLTGEYCNGKSWNPIMKWFYDCPFKGKHHENGKWWCGIHAPSKKAARQKKCDDTHRQKRRMKDAQMKVASARDAIASVAIGLQEAGCLDNDSLLASVWAYNAAEKELEALDADR